MKKQMGYADSAGIPYVALIGESEIAEGVVNLKDMLSGTQEKVSINELAEKLMQS